MIVKLDPRVPILWRSPSGLQLGVDPPLAVFDRLTETQERMLAALAIGIGLPGLTMVARGDAAQRDELLATVGPALLTAADREADAPLIAVSGSGDLAAAVVEVLARTGARVTSSVDAHDLAAVHPRLAVIVVDHVVPPGVHGIWLRRDVDHLIVTAADAAITVGPLVEPGVGPCLHCLELTRRDEDAAWPAIATQLVGRRPPALDGAVVSEAAALVTRLVLARVARSAHPSAAVSADVWAPVSVRLDAASGSRTERAWQRHPDCGCAGIEAVPAEAPEAPVPKVGSVSARRASAGPRGSGSARGRSLAPAVCAPS